MPSAKNSLNVTGSATRGATSGGGYQRRQKSNKPGAPWMKTEVTCARADDGRVGGWGWGLESCESWAGGWSHEGWGGGLEL